MAIGGDVYIPSAQPPPTNLPCEDMSCDVGGFSQLLGMNLNKNCEGSTSVGAGSLLTSKSTTSSVHSERVKRQKLTAVARLERSIDRVTAAYERKCDLIHSMKVEVEKCSLERCIKLLNKIDIVDGLDEWDFAYAQLASTETRQLFAAFRDANRRSRWILWEYQKLTSLFK